MAFLGGNDYGKHAKSTHVLYMWEKEVAINKAKQTSISKKTETNVKTNSPPCFKQELGLVVPIIFTYF